MLKFTASQILWIMNNISNYAYLPYYTHYSSPLDIYRIIIEIFQYIARKVTRIALLLGT